MLVPCLAQEDNFIPAMTSRETLTFYADITLLVKSSMTRRQRVEEVLAAVGLTAAANTLVRCAGLLCLKAVLFSGGWGFNHTAV
jgi:ABC-type multidrug transport system ATPase subunit